MTTDRGDNMNDSGFAPGGKVTGPEPRDRYGRSLSEAVRETYLSGIMSDYPRWHDLSLCEREAWWNAVGVARGEIVPVKPLPDPDEDLATVIHERTRLTYESSVPWRLTTSVVRERCFAAARAAREHIAAEGFARGGYVSGPDNCADHIAYIAHATAADPEPLLVEPPVTSIVRDENGTRWWRSFHGWLHEGSNMQRGAEWEHLRDGRGPLTLVSTPESEPWSPTPGAWATILPGADRGGVPEGVDRVLVTAHGTHGGPYVDVAWEGEGRWGDRADACLPASSLGPVRPRVWTDRDEIPWHVVVRDPNGAECAGAEAGHYHDGPFTEVLEPEQ